MAQARFTDQTKAAILEALRKGHFAKVAARLAGIHPSTFFYWVQEGEKDIAAGKDSTDFAAFARDVEKARAQAEHAAIQVITDHSKDDWKAAAWWLSRAHPERWAQRDWRDMPPAEDEDYSVDLSPPEDAPPSGTEAI